MPILGYDVDANGSKLVVNKTESKELLALGQFGYETMRNAPAARVFATAIEQNPQLADDRQSQVAYSAACCTALASAGEGQGEPMPDVDAKAELRGQALTWLEAELDRWKTFVKEHPEQSETVEKTLLHWQNDADLKSVREPDELSKLPETECAKWEEHLAESQRSVGSKQRWIARFARTQR